MRVGIEWRLGSLHSTSHKAMRRIERHLKDQKNAARFCTICSSEPEAIADTTAYPIALLPFSTRSDMLRLTHQGKENKIEVRLTGPDEPVSTMRFIVSLMKKDKDALGFIPAGGDGGLNVTHDKGLIAIVSNNGQDVGYVAFTLTHDKQTLNIHQCCVADDARLLGHGQALVQFLTEKFPTQMFTAKVRSDLAANYFWQALGFVQIREATHKTSVSKIVHYVLPKLLS